MQNLKYYEYRYDTPNTKYKANAIHEQLLKDKTTSDIRHSLHRYFNTSDFTQLEPYALYLGAIALEETEKNIRAGKKLKQEKKIYNLLKPILNNAVKTKRLENSVRKMF